jgi:hypothetical protein
MHRYFGFLHAIATAQVLRLCCERISDCSSVASDFDVNLSCVGCGSLQGDAGIVLESPDQNIRGFVVKIALPWWFLERAHQVFGEMSMRI